MRMKPARPSGVGALRAPIWVFLRGWVLVCSTRWKRQARTVAQVVQVPDRDRAQPREALISTDVALAAQHAGRGGARERAHGAIDLGQQGHVGRACTGGQMLAEAQRSA